MFRKFWLINGVDERYDFTLKDYKHFLNSPSGLGFEKALTTLRIGDDEIITSEEVSMPSVSGELVFYDSVEKGYQDYQDFIDFIRKTPLKLYYQPPNTLYPYYIECSIVSLEKSEYQQEGYMTCPISFYGNTLWTNSQETVITISNIEEGDGKFYDLKRPYNYAGSSLNNISVDVNGSLSVGFQFEIIGSVTNPRLTAYQDDTAYGLLKLDGTFDHVLVDSGDSSQSLLLENGGSVITNPLAYQDLSIADGVAEITFFKLKVGNSKLAFSCDKISSFDGTIKISWKDKRMSV